MAELGTGQVRSRLLDDEDERRDTEITLGTGKLLGIFFALAIVCAVFFTMGYLLGKSTAAGGRTEIVGSMPTGGSATGKPSAVNKAPEAPSPSPVADNAGPQSNAPAATATNNAPSNSGTPASSTDIKASSNGTFMVQVAAVSKQEDAEILVSALRKKQYPVFISNSSSDALFHVQVGPFTSQQDAEGMKNRLSADGYNAIVKKPST